MDQIGKAFPDSYILASVVGKVGKFFNVEFLLEGGRTIQKVVSREELSGIQDLLVL